HTEEMIVGRKSPDSVMLPDIDLAPFQADVMGVSRLHAGVRRQNDTLVLTDLGSLNHTQINGQRLHSHEVRVLHDGDELRFGQLTVRIYFRKE
ncbi:MAG: FHA domain-containing protein, partial [Chloroflexi bacterium]